MKKTASQKDAYLIKMIPEAAVEYKTLDGSVKKEVDKRLSKLEKNPLLGLPLGNKANMDLTGFYKLYACKKKIRIVYRLLTPEKIEVIEIWGIGKCEKMEIYKNISERKVF